MASSVLDDRVEFDRLYGATRLDDVALSVVLVLWRATRDRLLHWDAWVRPGRHGEYVNDGYKAVGRNGREYMVAWGDADSGPLFRIAKQGCTLYEQWDYSQADFFGYSERSGPSVFMDEGRAMRPPLCELLDMIRAKQSHLDEQVLLDLQAEIGGVGGDGVRGE